MIFPLNANKIESLDLDPIKKIEGYIWYNNVEKVYKTWINNELSIFITAKTFKDDIGKFLDEELFKHEFIVSMSDVYKVNIKQAVRQTGKVNGIAKLEGITDVGFRIEKIE